uniref:RNA-directed RNA polymerase n=1 Tax=Hubei levi-like virus 2 TaxID=1922914 RepID=A0A1L3KII5_9VIRU|nr:hypothetical protein [Hubei levi-like virus 2]
MAKIKPESAKLKCLAPEIRELAEVYYMSLNCPRSLTAAILLRYNEFEQLVRLKTSPRDFADPARYHLAASASDFLRKYPGLPLTTDPEKEAVKSWFQSEAECKRFNARAVVGFDAETLLLLDVASGFVADVLGPCPLDLSPVFGPGATVSDSARFTTVLDKVISRPSITDNARAFLSLWEGTAWERSHVSDDGYKKASYEPLTVEGNTFFTVPKNALTKRACAKGPSINVAYQLAVGRAIRNRFLDVLSLDLSNGQERHNIMAREGSRYGTFATLDSERASDTQSYALVAILLKDSGFWQDLLKSLREKKTKVGDNYIELEKFSAMGNGFTFELETLVFLSLCYSVAWAHQGRFPDELSQFTPWDLIRGGYISVYGDDVIVPSFMAEDVAAVLSLTGFTVNLKKSYLDGVFRESCGGDYFSGDNVNTFKLEVDPTSPADWFSIHNGIKSRFCDQYPSALATKHVLNTVKNQLPRQYRSMYGPKFLGDLVLHGWFGPQVSTRARTVDNLDGSRSTDGNQWVSSLRVLVPRLVQARFIDYSPTAQLAYFLYTHRSQAPNRRPVDKRDVRWDVGHWEGDYHITFSEQVPRAPRWLVKSPYARLFGINPEDGSYLG